MKQLLSLTLSLFCGISASSARDNVALVIGGYDAKSPNSSPVLDSVELFGCEGGPVRVANLPVSAYLMAGIYRFREESISCGTKDVLVCGGYICRGNACGLSTACHTWDPIEDAWSAAEVGNLTMPRWGHVMAHGPNLDGSSQESQEFQPIAVGYARTSEILDQSTNTWSAYREVPSSSWVGPGCFFQDHNGDEAIYHLRTRIEKIDVRDWSVTDLGPVPASFVAPGLCSPVEIDGQRGIYIRQGYFFGFEDGLWHKRAFPPNEPIALLSNAMWSLNGRPTIFGQPWCDESGACVNKEVIQYVPESDEWISLGDMLTARTYHEVVEVPGEFCDIFAPPRGLPRGHH